MTRAQFQSSEPLTRQLKELVENNEALKAAMDIVWKEGKPARPDPTKGDLLHQAALAGARAEGYFQFRDNLLSLTTLRNTNISKSQDETPGLSEAAIAAMVASGNYTEEEAKKAYSEYLKEQSTK